MALHKFTLYLSAAMFLAAIIGFWPQYFSTLLSVRDFQTHFHGLLMMLWCLMLAAQGFFIQTKSLRFHRYVGKTSYAIAPLIFLSIVALAHVRIQSDESPIETGRFFLLYVQFWQLALFALTYSLAVANRRKPAIHARYMICNAVLMIDAIFSRVLGYFVFTDADFAHWYFSLVIMDVILISLIAVDWKAKRKTAVYPAVLMAFITFQLGTLFIPTFEFWQTFAYWFRDLPLS